VLKQWQDLYDKLQEDISHAQKIAGVTPPGREFASADFINTGAQSSGRTLLDQHQKMSEYVTNYILALQKASGKLKQGEQLATDAVNSRKPGF
jgi:hypothetical protein